MNEDILNRLLSWKLVLSCALRNLGIAEHLSKHGAKDFETVHIAGTSFRTVIAVEAQQGLHEAAIVGFRQIFGWGAGGTGIACNRDSNILEIRNRMEQDALQKSGLSKAEFESLMDELKVQRDKRIAHYDGSAGEYRRINPSITAMKMPGCVLRQPQIDQLACIILAMSRFVEQEIKTLLTSGIAPT